MTEQLKIFLWGIDNMNKNLKYDILGIELTQDEYNKLIVAMLEGRKLKKLNNKIIIKD